MKSTDLKKKNCFAYNVRYKLSKMQGKTFRREYRETRDGNGKIVSWFFLPPPSLPDKSLVEGARTRGMMERVYEIKE